MTHNGVMSIYKQPAFAFWHLALRMLRRDLKAGELRLLLMALALAVAALSVVAFLSSRLDAALRRDAVQSLDAIRRISGSSSLWANAFARAAARPLNTVSF